MTTTPVTWSPDAQTAFRRLEGRLFATTTEVSVILGYDRQGRTLRKAIEAGEIPAVKAGATYRVPTAWLRKVVALGAETDTAGSP